jgi:hypothetical protein
MITDSEHLGKYSKQQLTSFPEMADKLVPKSVFPVLPSRIPLKIP